MNPVGSNWIIRDEVWGYGGLEHSPRRATIGTQSRCSKNLLDLMHAENVKGNHVSSEMTPQTVALHLVLKAVYDPIPMFFDREWPTRSLEKWFTPCAKGVSGSCQESAFGWGKEGRFSGSTWYFRAVSPMRLYNTGWAGRIVALEVLRLVSHRFWFFCSADENSGRRNMVESACRPCCCIPLRRWLNRLRAITRNGSCLTRG